MKNTIENTGNNTGPEAPKETWEAVLTRELPEMHKMHEEIIKYRAHMLGCMKKMGVTDLEIFFKALVFLVERMPFEKNRDELPAISEENNKILINYIKNSTYARKAIGDFSQTSENNFSDFAEIATRTMWPMQGNERGTNNFQELFYFSQGLVLLEPDTKKALKLFHQVMHPFLSIYGDLSRKKIFKPEELEAFESFIRPRFLPFLLPGLAYRTIRDAEYLNFRELFSLNSFTSSRKEKEDAFAQSMATHGFSLAKKQTFSSLLAEHEKRQNYKKWKSGYYDDVDAYIENTGAHYGNDLQADLPFAAEDRLEHLSHRTETRDKVKKVISAKAGQSEKLEKDLLKGTPLPKEIEDNKMGDTREVISSIKEDMNSSEHFLRAFSKLKNLLAGDDEK